MHLDELELLRADPGPLVVLLADLASIAEVDALRGLLAALRLRPREPAVPTGDAPESALTAPQLGPRAVLDPLDLEVDVLAAERAVASDNLGHFHDGPAGGVADVELLLKGFSVRGVRVLEDARTRAKGRRREPLVRRASAPISKGKKYILLN